MYLERCVHVNTRPVVVGMRSVFAVCVYYAWKIYANTMTLDPCERTLEYTLGCELNNWLTVQHAPNTCGGAADLHIHHSAGSF